MLILLTIYTGIDFNKIRRFEEDHEKGNTRLCRKVLFLIQQYAIR